MSQEKNIEVAKTPGEGVALVCLPSLINVSRSIENEKIKQNSKQKNQQKVGWVGNYITILRLLPSYNFKFTEVKRRRKKFNHCTN